MNRKIAPPSTAPLSRLVSKFAPPRFVLFGVVMALTAACGHLLKHDSWSDAAVIGFNLAVLVFSLSLWPLTRDHNAPQMRRHAAENDANRGLVLLITAAITITMMLAMAFELPDARNHVPWAMPKLISTLAMGWLFSNLTFALHYAHMFYGAGDTPAKDQGGLDFPGTKEPDYWDFIYFSFTAGMSFAASDVNVTSGAVRRVLMVQCLLAFVFNIGALAFSINVLAGA